MTGSSLAPMTGRDLSDYERVADKLSKARGFVPDIYVDKPGAVLAAILTGRALGLDPMTAIRMIHMIEGRATLSAELMLILARRAGVVHRWMHTDDEKATIEIDVPNESTYSHTVTRVEVDAAGISQGAKGVKDNWRKHGAAMLRARAQSAIIRARCPEVLAGGIYASEEIGDSPIEVVVTQTPVEIERIEALLVGQPEALAFVVRKSVEKAAGDVAELGRIEAKLRTTLTPHENVKQAAASAVGSAGDAGEGGVR